MRGLRRWIVPGLGYGLLLTMLAHPLLPGGIGMVPKPGRQEVSLPVWLPVAALPVVYPLICRLDRWVSGERRR